MPGKDSLARYRAKRDFGKTPEPGGVVAQKKGNSYLIQKHEASHLHYDFRLELDGTLKSWAVPKGPSLDPGTKRLAMEVEDHPVAYGSFEGIIPKGQYGGGTVMLWDQGSWEPVGDAREGLKKGHLRFRLNGKRLKGEWNLIRFHGREKARNQWFLIKHDDTAAKAGDEGKFVASHTTSVATRRSMDTIARDKDKVWGGKTKKTAKNKLANTQMSDKKVNAGGRWQKKKNAAFPGLIEPQLATLSTSMPKGPDWVHEIKFDGYRMLAYVEGGEVRMISRNGKDWTDAFAPLAAHIATLNVDNAVLDGEVVVVGKDNRSDFSRLKEALSQGDYRHMQYYAFDLLVADGENMRSLPLLERKKRLAELLRTLKSKASKTVLLSEHFSDDGYFLQNACSLHLEGVISKRADAPYLSGRGKSWLKVKCIRRQELVIGGFTLPARGSRGIGALLLGYYDGGQLRYAGRVGTGWNNDTSLELFKMLDTIRTKADPFADIMPLGRRKAIWVKPQLVCEVEFTEWTPDGHLRHPSFEGLRDDKKPQNRYP